MQVSYTIMSYFMWDSSIVLDLVSLQPHAQVPSLYYHISRLPHLITWFSIRCARPCNAITIVSSFCPSYRPNILTAKLLSGDNIRDREIRDPALVPRKFSTALYEGLVNDTKFVLWILMLICTNSCVMITLSRNVPNDYLFLNGLTTGDYVFFMSQAYHARLEE